MKTTVLSYSFLSALLTFSSAAHAVQIKMSTATPYVHVQPPNVGSGVAAMEPLRCLSTD